MVTHNLQSLFSNLLPLCAAQSHRLMRPARLAHDQRHRQHQLFIANGKATQLISQHVPGAEPNIVERLRDGRQRHVQSSSERQIIKANNHKILGRAQVALPRGVDDLRRQVIVLRHQRRLGQPNTALGSLIVVMVWGGVPSATILYLAGLQTIEKDLYEAAVIDGASAWQQLWNITWPLLLPVTVVIVITSINGVLQGYEMVYLMTYGGPAGHTEVVGLQIFKYGFGDQRQLGMASATSWALFLLVFIVAVINLRIFRSRTEV